MLLVLKSFDRWRRLLRINFGSITSDQVGSVAQWFGSAAWRICLERRFYDGHDRKINGSTPYLVSLLRPWIRCFTMPIYVWWNPTSRKLKKSEAKLNRKTRKQGQLPSESGFVLSIAPPPLSRDRRIKLKKSIEKLRVICALLIFLSYPIQNDFDFILF